MAFPAKVDIKYVEKASRLELFIRIALGIAYGLIAEVWAIFAIIAAFIQWFVILFTGKRNKKIHKFIAGFWRYLARIYSYIWMLTDERPPISGKA